MYHPDLSETSEHSVTLAKTIFPNSLDPSELSQEALQVQEYFQSIKFLETVEDGRQYFLHTYPPASKYWDGSDAPAAECNPDEEWCLHVCLPELVPHLAAGRWTSDNKQNTISAMMISRQNGVTDYEGFTSDNFKTVREKRALIRRVLPYFLGRLQDKTYQACNPFHPTPLAVVVLALPKRERPDPQSRITTLRYANYCRIRPNWEESKPR
ncbi:hypothetical protein EBZ37_12015, partial [bacterium]|nr:hypothetical protein [bacterium]